MSLTEEDIVKGCYDNSPKAQKMLYERFASKMLGVVLRYAKDEDEAYDILQDGFVKVFSKIHSFNMEGSLEGWIRRIMVNTALDQYRKNKKYQKDVKLDDVSFFLEHDDFIVESLAANDLMKIINAMPRGYRIVFNMFAVEGYSHKEIADKLGVSENTSKSQYSRARQFVKKILEEQNLI
ncbi:MAG: RNA polymerase sigma factor [Crocinitomicaceae bacterium]|nr:RNA polymerase sigma factor [Crocinitomicaceae bacterium]